MTDIKLAGLVGSLRRQSYSGIVMDSLQGVAPDGVAIERVAMRDLPFYDADLTEGGTPQPVANFAARLSEADAIVIVTPEYNRSFPGVLKNALDWVSKGLGQPVQGKPVAVISQSTGGLGGILANYHLRQVLSVMGAEYLTGSEIAINRIADKIANGEVTDAATREVLARDLDRLARAVRLKRG